MFHPAFRPPTPCLLAAAAQQEGNAGSSCANASQPAMEIDQITSLVSIFSFGQQIMAAASAAASNSTPVSASTSASDTGGGCGGCGDGDADAPAAAGEAAEAAETPQQAAPVRGEAEGTTPEVETVAGQQPDDACPATADDDDAPADANTPGLAEGAMAASSGQEVKEGAAATAAESDSEESDTSSDSGHSSDDHENDKKEEEEEEEEEEMEDLDDSGVVLTKLGRSSSSTDLRPPTSPCATAAAKISSAPASPSCVNVSAGL